MCTLTRYALAFSVVSLVFQACGKQAADVQYQLTRNASDVRSIQLNDAWNQAFPSQSITLDNDFRFLVPESIAVVGGGFAGKPGQFLHARIRIGSDMCEYWAFDPAATSLERQDCYGISQDAITTLKAGTVIELENYDAPGLLLEVHFTIAR